MRIIFISIFILGCNTLKNSNNVEREIKTIVGTWEFVSDKVIDPYSRLDSQVFQPINDSTYNILQFFGAEIIHESPGKTIGFTIDNQVKSNLTGTAGLDKFNFKYQYTSQDSLLTFTLMNPKDSSKIYIPTKTIITDSSMIWNIEDFIEITLKRVK